MLLQYARYCHGVRLSNSNKSYVFHTVIQIIQEQEAFPKSMYYGIHVEKSKLNFVFPCLPRYHGSESVHTAMRYDSL